MSYLLSVLIPTKNRKKYLLHCIQEVLSCCDDQVEVLIQDNSDIPLSPSELPQASNLSYYHEYGAISFVDNFSKAVGNAKGEYVCFIGDDDGITPALEPVVKWMKEQNVDAVCQNVAATYFWPNEQGYVKNSENGLLRLFYANCKVEKKNTSDELLQLLRSAGQGYLDRGLVKSYHGVVKRCYFEQIKQETGAYIRGLSPDIYAAVALSHKVESVYVVNYPLTISGICSVSGAGNSASGAHTGRLEDAPHFTGHANYHWEDLVPAMYSVETIWADSAMQAFRIYSKENVNKEFCWEYLLRLCEKLYPQFPDVYEQFQEQHSFSQFRYWCAKVKFEYTPLIKRGIRRLLRKPHDFVSIQDVPDITNANRLVCKYLAEQKYTIDALIQNLESLSGQ